MRAFHAPSHDASCPRAQLGSAFAVRSIAGRRFSSELLPRTLPHRSLQHLGDLRVKLLKLRSSASDGQAPTDSARSSPPSQSQANPPFSPSEVEVQSIEVETVDLARAPATKEPAKTVAEAVAENVSVEPVKSIAEGIAQNVSVEPVKTIAEAIAGNVSAEPALLPESSAAASVNGQQQVGVALITEESTASSSSATKQPPAVPVGKDEAGSNSSSNGSSRNSKATREQLSALKLKLFAKLSSLDRGIAANVQESREVERVVAQLETVCGPVQLSWDSGTIVDLFGNWRLLYSSGFNSGSLGGTRPGPPAALVPLVLGQVYQRINTAQGILDNMVEFIFSYNLPKIPFIPSEPESPAVRLTLHHTFEVTGSNTVQIVYENTSAELVGSSLFSLLPKLDLPSPPDFLKLPKTFRSATFDVTYLDTELRIGRGDRGELRIYIKDHESELPIADYED